MDRILSRVRRAEVGAIAVLAAGAVASCAFYPSSPLPVQATNPTVTYAYRSDQELLDASQSAATHCAQFGATPRNAGASSDPDGYGRVVFECVRTHPVVAQPPPPPPVKPGLTYSYRTDQELIEASRTAQEYCMRQGYRTASGTVSATGYGTKTATFQCGPV